MHRAGSRHKFFHAQTGELQVEGIRAQFDFVVPCNRPVFRDVYFFEVSPVVPGCEDAPTLSSGAPRVVQPLSLAPSWAVWKSVNRTPTAGSRSMRAAKTSRSCRSWCRSRYTRRHPRGVGQQSGEHRHGGKPPDDSQVVDGLPAESHQGRFQVQDQVVHGRPASASRTVCAAH